MSEKISLDSSDLKDIMPFDKFIIQYFYEGIS